MYRKCSFQSRSTCQDEAGQHPCVSRSSCSLGPHLTGPHRRSPALTDTICEQLYNATSSCPDMQLLQHYALHGWPPAKKLPHHQLQALWHFREELSIANGILLNSTRTIILTSLRPSMLSKIHQCHGGPEHCLRFSRDAIFWPNMFKDIDAYCQSCPSMESKPSLSLYYPILSLHDLGSSSRKIYLSSNRSST